MEKFVDQSFKNYTRTTAYYNYKTMKYGLNYSDFWSLIYYNTLTTSYLHNIIL